MGTVAYTVKRLAVTEKKRIRTPPAPPKDIMQFGNFSIGWNTPVVQTTSTSYTAPPNATYQVGTSQWATATAFGATYDYTFTVVQPTDDWQNHDED